MLASVQACFLFTLRAVARRSRMEFTRLELSATGTVARIDGVTRFTEIILRPQVTVPSGTDRGRMLDILARSEKACLVSASLSTPVVVEPEIQVDLSNPITDAAESTAASEHVPAPLNRNASGP